MIESGSNTTRAFADLRAQIESPSAESVFKRLYSGDPPQIARQRVRFNRLLDLFSAEYPQQAAVRLFSAPGRTEAGGNHTDHQHGRVLCASVNRDIIAAAAPNADRVIRLHSEGFSHADCISIDQLDIQDHEKGHSASLVRGVAAAFAQRGAVLTGFDILTSSEVPKGSGLSSSAAFEVLVATILNDFCLDGRLPAVELAKIGQWAENRFFGKPCGLMDQCSSAVGGFLSIDFQEPGQPQIVSIPFDLAAAGYDLVITDTGGSHADLTAEYASIPAEMQSVAACFSQTVLRNVSRDAFQEAWPALRSQVSDRALLRAAHFFAENDRVAEQAQALADRDLSAFFRMVRASGLSSWMLLQNVYASSKPAEQPLTLGLTAAARVLGDRGACRVHGGGFAGTIQAFVPKDLTDRYVSSQEDLFGRGNAHVMQIRPVGAVPVVFEQAP